MKQTSHRHDDQWTTSSFYSVGSAPTSFSEERPDFCKELIAAAQNNQNENIKKLISADYHSSTDKDKVEKTMHAALRWAASDGYEECVKTLFHEIEKNEKERFSGMFGRTSVFEEELGLALRAAASNGHSECLKFLISVVDSKETPLALKGAARNGQSECVQLLIPFNHDRFFNSQALQSAAYNGHAECVELLIPVSHPASFNSISLSEAARNKHIECVRLLIPVSDVQTALATLRKGGDDEACNLIESLVQRTEMLSIHACNSLSTAKPTI